jgi:hypothetical protein
MIPYKSLLCPKIPDDIRQCWMITDGMIAQST